MAPIILRANERDPKERMYLDEQESGHKATLPFHTKFPHFADLGGSEEPDFFCCFLRESACYSTISAKLQILPKIESLQCSQGTGHVDNWCRAEVPCDQS